MWRRTSSLHIPGYLISLLTGWSIKTIHELRRFLRLLLLNINYLRYHFLSNIVQKKIWILNTLPVRGNPLKQYTNWGILCVYYCWISTIYDVIFYQNHAEKNMDFEHPTIFGIEEGVLRATRPMKESGQKERWRLNLEEIKAQI